MLTLDEDRRLATRQELLEALSSGMCGPACAPMPGGLMEMLEIAAMERRRERLELGAAEDSLTSAQNSRGMLARLLRNGILNGARSFAVRLADRRLSARHVSRTAAP